MQLIEFNKINFTLHSGMVISLLKCTVINTSYSEEILRLQRNLYSDFLSLSFIENFL